MKEFRIFPKKSMLGNISVKITRKFILTFLFLSLFPLIFVGIFAYKNGEEALRQRLGLSYIQIAFEAIDKIDRSLFEVYRDVSSWSKLDMMQNVGSDGAPGRISSFLRELKDEYKYFATIDVMDKNGTIVASSTSEFVGLNIKDDISFQRSSKGQIFVKDILKDNMTKQWVVSFSFPIRDKSDRKNIRGVFVAKWMSAELLDLTQHIASLHGLHIGLIGGHVLILRQDGLIISAPEVRKSDLFKLNLIQEGLAAPNLAKKNLMGFLIERNEAGQDILIGYHRSMGYRDFPGLGWTALVAQDARIVFSSIERLKLIIFASASFLALIVIVASVFLARRMTKPIIEISGVANEVSKGNFEGNVQYNENDEIGYLAKTFNQMIRDLKEQRMQLVDKKYLDSIIENMVDALIVFDQEGYIKTMNKAALDLLNYTEEDLRGDKVDRIFDHEESIMRGDRMEKLIRYGSLQDYEMSLRAKSGERIPVSFSASVMREGKGQGSIEGEVLGIVGMARDLSERKRTESALAAEKERLAVTLRSIGDGVITTDTEGRIMTMNKIAENLSGWNQSEAINKSLKKVFTIVNQHTHDNLADPVDQVLNTDTMVESRDPALLIGWDKKERLISYNASPLRDSDGKMIGVVLVFRDITDQEKFEHEFRQMQKMEALGRLAGGVAHDFNNLLTVIRGFAALRISRLPADDPARKDLKEIENAAERAANLTQQLLSFSRHQTLEPKDTDLNELVKGIQTMLHRLMGEDVEFELDLASDLGLVKVDPGHLEQVLVNLAVNARDAMPDGGKFIIETSNVTLDPHEIPHHLGLNPGKYIMISAKDTGHGMTEEVKNHLFEPFFTTKEKGKGTGLGLATCYGIIRRSGGFVTVNSRLNQGSVFEIYFPEVTKPKGVSKKDVSKKEKKEGDKALPQGTETVLLAEDEPSVRNLTANVLRHQGYTVLEAKDGEEALRIAEEKQPNGIDLLLTDVVMPKMGGRELVEKFRIINQTSKIMFMSGYSDKVIIDRNLSKVGVSFLQKPFTNESLLIGVRSILDKQPTA